MQRVAAVRTSSQLGASLAPKFHLMTTCMAGSELVQFILEASAKLFLILCWRLSEEIERRRQSILSKA
jgi:hypothetical protein